MILVICSLKKILYYGILMQSISKLMVFCLLCLLGLLDYTFFPGCPLSHFWLGVPNLSRFAILCSRMANNLLRFYLYVRKNHWRQGLCPGPCWGSLWCSSRLQFGPPTAHACGACTLRFISLPLFPDCSAQIMVTLCMLFMQSILFCQLNYFQQVG